MKKKIKSVVSPKIPHPPGVPTDAAGRTLSLKNANTAARKQRILDLIPKYEGLVSYAYKAAGVTTDVYYEWIHADNVFKEAVYATANKAKEARLDVTESMLRKNIREGKEASIFFELKCLGKNRGYIERTEMLVGSDKDAPIIPESLVQSTLTALLDAERKRLSDSDPSA